MRKSKITLGVIVINVFFIALVLLLNFKINDNEKKYYDGLLKLEYSEYYNLDIINSYNQRGIMIMNEKYFVSSSLNSINSANKISEGIIKIEANHSLTFGNIVPPFRLIKEAQNDTLRLRKNGHEFQFILDEY